ncbi:ricin-type beta-trefoil lectin domain protein [Kitasatospora arboriphila]
MQLQTCNGAATQTWAVRADGTILNATANLCIAVPGDTTTNGTDVVLAACGTPVPATRSGPSPTTPPPTSTTPPATSSFAETPARPPSPSAPTNSRTTPPPRRPPAPGTTRSPPV